jgi:hypothetical protein
MVASQKGEGGGREGVRKAVSGEKEAIKFESGVIKSERESES